MRRRATTAAWFAGLLWLGLSPAWADVSGAAPAVSAVEAVETVSIVVSDLDRAVAFYQDVLTFEPISQREVHGPDQERLLGVLGVRRRVARLRLGQEQIELTEYLVPTSRPIPRGLRSNDRSFQHIAIIVRDMDAAYTRLKRHRVTHVSPRPQRLPDWNPNAGGIQAFYFKDPDGHVLEILQFPEGKGDPKWHQPTEELFLGVDHTAIVVADMDASLRFYRDALGLRVVGESENHGPEQERLNNVRGAHLRITTLRAAEGPGIELLEYLAPRTGRPAPPDRRAYDLLRWQTVLRTRDARAAASRLCAAGGLWCSLGAVELSEADAEFSRGLVAEDPDGHALEVRER